MNIVIKGEMRWSYYRSALYVAKNPIGDCKLNWLLVMGLQETVDFITGTIRDPLGATYMK